MRRIVSLWAAWLLVAVAACGDAGRERLEHARDTWRAVAVVDDSFRYRTTGFAPPVDIRVTVDGGTVTDVERLGGQLDVPDEDAPTIESLFQQIALALDDGAVEVRADYDPALGYPIRASFDGGEEGDAFEVSELATSR
jgi:hypothetical protein